MSSTGTPCQIVVPEFPKTLDHFIALRDALAVTPEGGAVMMVLALAIYAADPEARFGREALVIAVDHSRLVPVFGGYKGWDLNNHDLQHISQQMVNNPCTPKSYFVGTSPVGGYRLPQPPYRFELSRNLYSGEDEEGLVKVFIATSGAPSPRPVQLQRNNHGLWKALEWSSLTVGVDPPEAKVDDDL